MDKHTNYNNLSTLLNGTNYVPHNFGIITDKERKQVVHALQIECMSILELRNLRDFVVLYFQTIETTLFNMDRMSAITSVIDGEIIKKGGYV